MTLVGFSANFKRILKERGLRLVAISEATGVPMSNGAGIPEEYLRQIGSKRITFKGGSERGIGIMHAFKTVEAWGGEIAIESMLGEGTTVRIVLPKYLEGRL